MQAPERFAELFGEFDRQALSRGSFTLNQTMQELLDAIEAGEEISGELIGEMRRARGAIRKHASVIDGVVDGYGPDDKVHYPDVVGQWLGAMLHGTGFALDDTQRPAVEDLSARFGAERQRSGSLQK